MWDKPGLTFILKLSALLISCLFFHQTLLRESAQATHHPTQHSVETPVPPIDFNRDIRPILSEKCFVCHGPDAPNKRIRLRLDSEAGALADLGGGRRAIVPGHPEQSELVRRITAEDEMRRMPPTYSGSTLTGQEIELLKQWIKQGAQWQKHWSLIAPIKPELPQIKNRAWPRNEIDYFVLARLEREGLQPSPEADRATLIRRASLDLTGLPPTPAEIDSFLADKSPQAYEKVVDRLLASPRYGERMAFRWLDAARYADTNGYQIDGERSMWRWRDWVIEAFNRNMPFDQFIIEQLAGDLLPNPTLDQRIATAFNRNHRTNSEDGIVPEEYAVEYVVDRVDTVSTVFLGLTMSCARCHNHKYDPITQKEYYQLFAYFNSIAEDGRVSNHGNAPPWIAAPTREQQGKLRQLENDIAQTENRLALLAKNLLPAQRRWEQSLASVGSQQWFPNDNLLLHHSFDKDAAIEINEPAAEQNSSSKAPANPAEIGFKGGMPVYCESPAGQGVEFNGNLFFDAGKAANFNYRDRIKDFKDKFTISAWFYPQSEHSGAIVTRMQDNVEAKEDRLPKGRGYGVFFVNSKVHFNLVSVWADDSFRVETEEKLPIKKWHHLLATFDSSQPYEKVQIYINGQKQKLKINNARLFRSFADGGANLRIGGGGGPEWRFNGMIDEVRIYKSLPDAAAIAMLSCPDPLDRVASIPPEQRTEGQRLKMLNAFLERGAPAAARQVWKRLRELKQEKERLEDEFPTVMVMQEAAQPQPAFILKRGAYDAPGEKVERGVPTILHQMPEGTPNNRLGFAKWLVHPSNPLTARVTVNRFWQMLFGAGLVKTTEDFGVQGELPSHPELLDYLATEFQRAGWNIKALLKMIVMSATYRQSSKVTQAVLQRDPENRLLARGPRFRLPAEMIRDQTLFVSGLLVEQIGGPSVKPYQPEGLWDDLVFKEFKYIQDKGDKLYRRSLYTYWKRTITPPAMATFDAATRESCTVREARTNTPLQALNLMNDVTYIEAARSLAERMLREGSSKEVRIRFAFRLATSRWPKTAEMEILLDNLNAQLDYFRNNPGEAVRLLQVGEKSYDKRLEENELAAYSAVASLILNLDEVITKE